MGLGQVTGMRIFRGFCLLAACLLLAAGSSAPKATLRFHIQRAPMSGPNPDQMIPVQLFEPQQMIYVSRFADLAEKDIDSVEFLPNGSVLVQFDEIGRGRLDALTRAGIGSVLVVFCNGRVVYAPQIDVAVTNGRLLIPSGIVAEEVKALQEQIRRRKK